MTRISNSMRIVRYERLLLLCIILIALLLRIGNVGTIGAGNTYYTAAVDNMLDSASNFFYATADAGGVTVDKPPVGLWIQAIFARVLGVSGWSVVLPSMLAGVLGVWVIYRMLKPRWGIEAGLLAAFVLAITPVSIAVDRTNNLDSLLNLCLLLATWAFWHATDSDDTPQQWRALLLGAVLVGIAFNIKMLQAYLIVPALYALYFLGAKTTLRAKLGQLFGATLVLLVVSFSWAFIVDATPADSRPYIGGSETNSVIELIVGYNGLGRLLGVQALNTPSAPDDIVPDDIAPDYSPAGTAPNNPRPATLQGGANAFRPGGDAEIGTTGMARLLVAPLANELAWFLPLAGLAMILLLFSERVRFPLSAPHQALVLWGGWLVTGGIFFSVSSFFHAYYLATLAPALAALIGIGWSRLGQLDRVARRRWQIVVGGVGFLTVIYQQSIIVTDAPDWGVVAYGAFALFAVALVLHWRGARQWASGLALVALMSQPMLWAGVTAYHEGHNTTLPAAYPAQVMPNFIPSRPTATNTRINPSQNPDGLSYGDLATYLVAHYGGETYFVAVPDAMIGAPLTLMGDYAVLYTGGFNGQDAIYSADDIAQLVNGADLRFILTGGGVPSGQSQTDVVTDWAEAHCVPAEGFVVAMPSSPSAVPSPGLPSIMLYDCGQVAYNSPH